ncbi:MAG: hypothetical protein ACR2PG_26645, partial [Hyphomicrobiaceae bacterium]
AGLPFLVIVIWGALLAGALWIDIASSARITALPNVPESPMVASVLVSLLLASVGYACETLYELINIGQ